MAPFYGYQFVPTGSQLNGVQAVSYADAHASKNLFRQYQAQGFTHLDQFD